MRNVSSEQWAALVRRYDVPAPRYTSYPPVPAWSAGWSRDAARAALEAAGQRESDPLSLYVHLPFCKEICTYCGCNVVGGRSSSQADEYLMFLAREIELVGAALGARRRVAQLHLGGGTPTYFDESQLGRLWELLSNSFTFLPDAELAIEIDPRVTRASQIEQLREIGFSRLSLGVQDADADVQRAIGRGQTEEQTRAAFTTGRRLGFAVSIDLVYGLPMQTDASWARTLDFVTALAPDRLSLFSFAYVPEARPKHRKLPIAHMPVGASKLALFVEATRRLVEAGYEPVGMDHFARPGDPLAEAARAGTLHRNFQGYTLRAADTLIGLGASAISDLGTVYLQNAPTLGGYYGALASGKLPTVKGYVLDDEDQTRRAFITKLLCTFQGDLSVLADGGASMPPVRALAQDGLVQIAGSCINVTPLGRLFIRNIAATFDAHTGAAALPRALSQSV